MTSKSNQRLELTWFNKDKALIPTENGKYGYQWVDPRDPRYCETHTLVLDEYVSGVQADREDGLSYSALADLEPQTDNLLFNGESGDVLEALTRVPELVEKYVGKVKLCYIDPPFNTEKTFTHYEDNLEHSVWLTMVRDRLLHIKKLLAEEGSIWVHLDHSENHRMRVLLDEVFGAKNFVAEIAWQKRTSRENRAAMSDSYDMILVYSRGPVEVWKDARNRLDRSVAVKNVDNDPRGPWDSVPFTAQGSRPNQMYTITTPTGVVYSPPRGRCWGALESEFERLKADGRIHFPNKGNGRPRVKQFASEAPGLVPHTLWTASEVGDNDAAKKGLMGMFPDQEAFATPKPEHLLERIIHIATNPGDIVLDVFAGSGTTAAVAQKMGRRWVACELLESNFATFTLPRLRKVVRGEDPGGITTTPGERVDATEDGLPGDLSASEAFGITQSLSKAAKVVTAPVDLAKVVGNVIRDDAKSDDPVLDSDEAKELRRLMRKLAGSDAAWIDFLPHVRKAVGEQLKTRKSPDTINWRGGGGFQVAHLSPTLFDYDLKLGLVTLTDAAFEGDNLARGVAAHLNYRLTPEHRIFTGKRGRTRLAVTTVTATPETVQDLVNHLEEGENLVIASTAVDPDSHQAIRKARKGSRVLHIPNDLFRVNEIEAE